MNPRGPPKDSCSPQGECGFKVVRGGSSETSPDLNYTYHRLGVAPQEEETGFRCVINSDLPKDKLRQIAMAHLR